MVKCLCYMVLTVTLLMFFQSSPAYALVVVFLIVGVYFLFKRRQAHGAVDQGQGFFSGLFSRPNRDSRMDDLVLLMTLSQVLGSNNGGMVKDVNGENVDKTRDGFEEIDRRRDEVIGLLED